MPRRYVITLTAANRVGILAAVTEALSQLGGNLVEIRQTVVQKFFTIILAADFPDERLPHVVADHIRDIGRPFGIAVCLKDPAEEILQPDHPAGSRRYMLTATGNDQPGVMRRIAARLACHGVDITGLSARRNEPDGTFVMSLRLAVPPDIDALTLQSELEQIGRPVGLEAVLEPEQAESRLSEPMLRFAP